MANGELGSKRLIGSAFALTAAAALIGCEPTGGSNAGANSGGGGGAGGGSVVSSTMVVGEGIAGLVDERSSLLGRAASRGTNLANDIAASQSRTSGLADDIMGNEMVEVGSVRFPVPAGWTVGEPSNRMRAAEMLTPGGAVVAFSRVGGDIESNMRRWIGQVSPVDTIDRRRTDIAGRPVHTLAASGTYLDGGMMTGAPTPRIGWGLYGAMIQGERDGSTVFVKMTGPIETIEADLDGWAALLHGMQAD